MTEISADLGEGSPREDEIWPLVHAANVACGGHAGDVNSMLIATENAARYGVILGAHPSYPDRENFGRVSLSIAEAVLEESLLAQLGALRAVATRVGIELRRVKPHGALYNDAHRDPRLAALVVRATLAAGRDLALVASESSAMAAAAREAGVTVVREAFADRRYRADGSLVPRAEARALLTVDEAAEQAARLASERTVLAIDGSRLALDFDTLCVHADMEQAVERLRAIRSRLGRPHAKEANIDAP